jgi:hypothetical protein
MKPEHIKNSELDNLMRNALTSNNDMIITPGISDKIILKLEKKTLLRELLLELSFKVGLALGSLALLAGVFTWVTGSDVLSRFYTHFVSNRQLFISTLLVVFVTILIDQVALRFYITFNKEVNLKI